MASPPTSDITTDSSPPSSPSSPPSSSMTADPNAIAHAVALGAVVAAPVLMLMPPRKLDLYTFVVAGCGVYGANHLVRERHGVGMMGLAGRRLGYEDHPSSASSSSSSSTSSTSPPSLLSQSSAASSVFSAPDSHARPGHEGSLERFSLPTERARSLHEALAADRAGAERRRAAYGELRVRAAALARDGWGAGGDVRRALHVARATVEDDARRHGWAAPVEEEEMVRGGSQKSEVAERKAQARHGEVFVDDGDEANGTGVKGLVKKVWMGGETDGWKERRLAEEQKALDEGKGYSDLIVDQIWEVWNWDKKKNEDGEWVSKDGGKPR